MDSKGQIKYSFIQMGRNRGQLTIEEKEKMIASGLYTEVFNEEELAKDEFEIFGFII